MSSNDIVRASISATLEEIVIAHQILEIPPEPQEMAEAMAIIQRIESRLAAMTMQTGPKTAEG